MKRKISNSLKYMAAALFVGLTSLGLAAQNSLPAPGSGGGFNPAPSNGIGWNPGPAMPPPPPPTNWGNPWNPVWVNGPSVVVSPSVGLGNFQNQGIVKVLACGYDAQGVWRVLPLLVSYQYNGIQYNVNVLNAWNPWTDQWERGVDVQAFNTTYILRGVNYNFYVVLPYGTFYFNL